MGYGIQVQQSVSCLGLRSNTIAVGANGSIVAVESYVDPLFSNQREQQHYLLIRIRFDICLFSDIVDIRHGINLCLQ